LLKRRATPKLKYFIEDTFGASLKSITQRDLFMREIE
jgi:hypothetical protein